MDNNKEIKLADAYARKPEIKDIKDLSHVFAWVFAGILIIGLLPLCTVAHPTDSLQQIVVDSTTIHFKQGKYNLDLGLDGNGEKLKAMLHHLQDLTDKDSTYILSTVRVIGSASP